MTDAAGIAKGLSSTLRIALADIAGYDHSGYAWNWKQKSREKLQAVGLVGPLVRVHRHGQNIDVCRITDLGRAVASLLEQTND